jgi:hypothetical protein
LAYIIKQKGTEGWTFRTRTNAPVIKSVWDSEGAQRFEAHWDLELRNGAQLILLLLYWDDFRRNSKRLHKVNAFYLRILNDEVEQRIYPISYVPSERGRQSRA